MILDLALDAHTVSVEQSVAFAEATGDLIPAHRSGLLCPPTYAIGPVWPALANAITATAPKRRLAYAQHDVRIIRPLTPGMSVVSQAQVFHQRTAPHEHSYRIRAWTYTRAGQLINKQHIGLRFSADPTDEPLPNSLRPRPATGDHQWAVQHRYAADVRLLRELTYSSLPANMKLAAWADIVENILGSVGTIAATAPVVLNEMCSGDPTFLNRIAASVSKPAVSEQQLHTKLRGATGSPSARHVTFETTSHDGALLLTDGIAEIRTQ